MTSVKDVEYRIRKLQRGIGAAAKTNKAFGGGASGALPS